MNLLTIEEINALFSEEEEEASRILIVDDEKDYLAILSSVLSKLGYEVETAESGEEAIQKVFETPPHIMLLDVRMPGRLGGPKTLRLVKESFSETKVIMVSAVRDQEMMKEAFESGASGYIIKPFDLDDLKKMISSANPMLAA